MDIRIELPGVKLGVVEADDVAVALVNPELAQEMQTVSDRLRREMTVEQVAELEPVRAVRTMFRAWGVDPDRYRPSAEALLRRVAQGKGLYRISNVVDANNLGSIETGWPYGCYNRAVLAPPVTFRAAARGETYEGIGKQTWHLEGRPVLADASGPFGSPISDSTRTMITEETRQLLAVIYAPASAPDAALQQAMDRMARRFERNTGARATRIALVTK
jgi:DNA/RNA-binding domain of Phe-tRNA-synthetase-like protein